MGYFVLAVIGAAAAFWLTKRRQEEQIALQLSAAKAQAESTREAAQQQAQEQLEACLLYTSISMSRLSVHTKTSPSLKA